MKEEAIRALELFRQQHLSQPIEAPTQEPKKQKGVNFNYPDHIKPLKERMMTGLKNGNRTAEAIANYCKADVKLVALQLGRYVSRGMIGKQTNPQSGITRFYPYEEAKEKGILCAPQPINRKKKVKQDRSSSYQSPAQATKVTQAEAFVMRNEAKTNPIAGQDYITFLENRMTQWQAEARKQAQQILELQDALAKAHQTRDVTSEVTEVMEEVMQLRGTVAYLESKLFGGK